METADVLLHASQPVSWLEKSELTNSSSLPGGSIGSNGAVGCVGSTGTVGTAGSVGGSTDVGGSPDSQSITKRVPVPVTTDIRS